MKTLLNPQLCTLNSANKFKQVLTTNHPWMVVTFVSLFLLYKYLLQISSSVMTYSLMVHAYRSSYFNLHDYQLALMSRPFISLAVVFLFGLRTTEKKTKNDY